MIDIHNHLIPGIDDGSDSLELSRTLLKDAIEEGITHVCITPHYMKHGPYKVERDELIKLFYQFKESVKDLNVNLYLGNELYIDKELDELLLKKRICSLNNTKYVLVEFPFHDYKSDFDEYLYDISLNYKIIIAHPERYSYVQKDHDFVKRWLKNGYYLQANATSLWDREEKKALFSMIEKGQLSFIASDAHNKHRPLSLIDTYELISKKFNEETAKNLMYLNPALLLQDKKINRLQPAKRKLF